MDFVADESCVELVVRALRDAGHNVIAIAEVAKGATDEQVLAYSLDQKRVLITEDRDFGELVYVRGRPTAGIILLRFPSSARIAKPVAVVEAVGKLGSRLHGAFTTIEPGRVRMSSRP